MARRRPRVTPTKLVNKGKPFQDFVASVAQAMDPTAKVTAGQWVRGPDGRRDMDVLVEGNVDDRPFRVLIECKDYNPNTTGKVGIEFVDAIDSKRHDLRVDATVICSNSGFTQDAIRKGKRKHIGLISVLKAGDPRVKAVIEEEIYTRHVAVGAYNVTFHGTYTRVDSLEEITYQGLPVLNWLMNRVVLIVAGNPLGGTINLVATFRLLTPTEMYFGASPGTVTQIDVRFPVETRWFSQLVTLDASLGMYDYIRGRVRLAPGERQYTIKGVDIHDGTPIDFVPDRSELGAGLLPGEIHLDLMLVNGIAMPDKETIPDLDRLIDPTDLQWRLPYGPQA
jgi:hypothetical protein